MNKKREMACLPGMINKAISKILAYRWGRLGHTMLLCWLGACFASAILFIAYDIIYIAVQNFAQGIQCVG